MKNKQNPVILGIVAEYDPFHRGHARHLRLAKEAAGADYAYAVLSPCFCQRGEPSLFSPHDRAKCALEAGIDAVFALRADQVLRDAEHYAFSAVSLLNRLGCTHLGFGAETDDLPLLRTVARFLEDPPSAFRLALKRWLDQGLGFPSAREAALREVLPEAGTLLSCPNNILAICYLRALFRLKSPMRPVLIRRTGAYHAAGIDPEAPSASALRGALRRGNWLPALEALPDFSGSVVRAAFLGGRVADPGIYDALLLHRLRSMTPDQAALLPDLSEGLEKKLLREAGTARTRDELLNLVSGRRYPRARISRLCAWALLDSPAPDETPAESVLLLGLRRKPEMTSGWRDLPLKILSSLSEAPDIPAWSADRHAWRIWAQCSGLPDSYPFTVPLVRLPDGKTD